MDEYSEDNPDEDISLGNLHYGLDSSMDESGGRVDKLAVTPVRHPRSGDGPSNRVAAEYQMNQLQDMVLEMKEGFQTAMEELMKIQVKEEAETNHSKKLQAQQQEQLAHLAETVGEIQQQLSSLTKSVEQIKDEQKMLKEGLEKVRSDRDSSQGHHILNERASSRPNLRDDCSAHSEERNSTHDDATEMATKSFNLIQALDEECLRHDPSANDEEDGPRMMRMSKYRQKTAHPNSDQTTDNHQTLSVHAGLQDRSINVGGGVHRQKAVTDLADAERDYCSQLWILLHSYLTPLQTSGILSARELDILLPPYLDQLYTEHCHICTELQNRLMHWTYMTTVADLVSLVADSYNSDSLLTLYMEYANDLPAALTFLTRALAQSMELRLFLLAIKHSNCQSQDLRMLLLAPVQRIPKYLLQVQEIARHTPPTHADFPQLQTLLHQLQFCVDQLNDTIANTMDEWNYNWHSGPEILNGHLQSAQDNETYSNQIEGDHIPLARTFYKNRSHVSTGWLETPSDTVHQRQPRPSSGHFGSLSHSDLMVYKNMSNLTADPQMFAHIPRSQSPLPAGSSDHAAARQRIQNFKIKQRSPSPARYSSTTQDHMQSSPSPAVRPTSSVDFIRSQNHQQQQHKHNNKSDAPGQLKDVQPPIPQPRPHSALETHARSTSHRPVVISRKNVKRIQPQISTSNTVSDGPTSENLPTQMEQQKMHMTVNNLLPSRPTTPHSSNIYNGCDDEEDDTRSSDIYSHNTRGSHPDVHSHGTNEHNRTEFIIDQDHVGSQSPSSNGRDIETAHSQVFKSPNISKVVSNPKQEASRDNMSDAQANKEVLKSYGSRILEQQSRYSANQMIEKPSRVPTNQMTDNLPSRSLTNQITDKSSSVSTNDRINNKITRPFTNQAKDNESPRPASNPMKEQVNIQQKSLILSNLKDNDEPVNSSDRSTKQENVNSSLLTPSNNCANTDNSASQVSPTEPNVFHRRNKRSNLPKSTSDHEQSVHNVNMGAQDSPEKMLVNNRQFLMSLTRRVPPAEKINLNKTSSVNNSNDTDVGNLQEFPSNNSYPQSNSDATESPNPDLKEDAGMAILHPSPRISRIENENFSLIPVIENHPGKTNTKPVPPPKKYIQTPVSHSTNDKIVSSPARNETVPSPESNITVSFPARNETVSSPGRDETMSSPTSINSGFRASPDSLITSSPLKKYPDLNQTSSTRSQAHKRSSSHDASNFNRNSQLSGKQRLPGKPNPLSTTNTVHAQTHAATVHEMSSRSSQSRFGHENGYNGFVPSRDENELRPLDMSDVYADEGKKTRSRESILDEMKDEGIISYVDSLPVAAEDSMNTRKKHHFKASLKNLFAKKKVTESDV